MIKKQATIKDVARELQISHSTVSRALSADRKVSALVKEETRKRVQQVAAELDYSPNIMAQGFVTGRTGTLGLLTYQISLEMFGRQTNQILQAADKQKYRILMGMAPNRFQELPLEDQTVQIRQLLSRGIDGLLIHTRGDQGESERILKAVRGRMPVVTFTDPIQNLSGVVLEETTSFCEVTEHLIGLGHERIGFVGADWNENFVGSAKGKGYQLAMQKHGLTPKRISGKTFPKEPTRCLGERGERLGDRFTALVCRNDYEAIIACHGLRAAGFRVPEDVAVVGNGNLELAAYMTPALTTLAIPYEAIAQEAMELMLEQLEGRQDEPRQVALKSSLVVRESCGANNKK